MTQHERKRPPPLRQQSGLGSEWLLGAPRPPLLVGPRWTIEEPGEVDHVAAKVPPETDDRVKTQIVVHG